MAVTFDGDARVITEVGIGGDQTLDVVGIYAEWKQWVLAGNANFLQAFSTIGGDEIETNVNLGSTFFLENGWRMRPAELDHRLTLEGNLYVRGGGDPFVPTLGNFNVLTQLRVSNLVDQINVSGSGVSLAELRAELALVPASVRDVALLGSAPDSFGQAMEVVLGITAKGRVVIDNHDYDLSTGFLRSCRVRVFPTNALAAAATPGATASEGEIWTSVVSGTAHGILPQAPQVIQGVGV